MTELKRRIFSAELFWIACGHVINLAGLIAALKLLTSLLGPSAFGEYALGLAIAGIIQLFVYGPISQATLRFFSIKREKDKLNDFFSFLIDLQFKAAALLAIAGIVASVLVTAVVSEAWGGVTITATVAAIAGGIITSITSIFTANRDRVVVALFQGGGAIMSAIFSVGNIYVFSAEGHNALIGYAVWAVIQAILYYQYLKVSFELPKFDFRFHTKNNQAFADQFWIFARPFVFFALFGCVVNYGDRWMVQALFSQDMVGIYTAIFQIANTPLSLFGTIVAQLVLPVLYATSRTTASVERQAHLYRLIIAISGACLLIAVVIAFFFSEFILALLTSPDFVLYHKVLWVMVLGCAIFQFAQLTVMRGLVELRPHAYIKAKAIHATSFLFIILLFGNHYSLMGVALAISLSSLFYLMAITIANRGTEYIPAREYR